MALHEQDRIDGLPVKTIKALISSPKTHPNVKKAWEQKLMQADKQMTAQPRKLSRLNRMT